MKKIIVTAMFTSALFAMSAPAIAQEASDPRPVLTQIGAFVRGGQYDEARALLQAVGGTQIDFLYLGAEINVAQGDIAGAIDLMRGVVALAPNAEGPRRFLAELLIADRQFDNARFQYEQLRIINPSPQARQYYTDQIANIDAYQPYGVSYQFELVPSNNINGAEVDGVIVNPFTGEVAEKPDELQPQFGWRATLNTNAFLRTRIADQQEISLNLSSWINRYTYDTLDSETIRLGLNYRFQNSDSTLSVGPYFLWGFGDGEVYSTSVDGQTGQTTAEIDKIDEDYKTTGWSLFASQIINPKLRASFNLDYSHTVYDDEDYDYRENYRQRGGLGVNYSLNERNILGLNLTLDRYEERGGRGNFESHNSYSGYTADVSLSTVYENQWRTEMGLSFTRRDYDELYPLYTEERWDEITAARFSVQNANWQLYNFVPRLSCSGDIRDSNIDAFNTSQISCGVSLTTEF